jgi:CubicO group peptidase (beta-lactamase class C family)
MLGFLSTQAQEMAKVADSIRKSRFVPSLAYAVMNTDSIIEMAAVGFKKLRAPDTVTIKSRYHLGNNTTGLTAYIAAQLVAKGKIMWNTKLAVLFPDALKTARPEYKDVTLADILSQRAGFVSFNTRDEIRKMPHMKGYDGITQRKDFVSWITHQRGTADSLGRKPVRYTNAGSIVAAAMLEKVTGKTYAELMEEYVNKPLGINVKFRFPNRSDVTETWGHANIGGVFQGVPPDEWWQVVISPAMEPVDANLSIQDYAKFAIDNLRGLENKKAIMPQRAYELLQFAYPDYAMGWGNLEVDGNHIAESDGGLTTFFVHIEVHK